MKVFCPHHHPLALTCLSIRYVKIYIYLYTHRHTYIYTHIYVCFKRCPYFVKTWTLTFFLTSPLLPQHPLLSQGHTNKSQGNKLIRAEPECKGLMHLQSTCCCLGSGVDQSAQLRGTPLPPWACLLLLLPSRKASIPLLAPHFCVKHQGGGSMWSFARKRRGWARVYKYKRPGKWSRSFKSWNSFAVFNRKFPIGYFNSQVDFLHWPALRIRATYHCFCLITSFAPLQ